MSERPTQPPYGATLGEILRTLEAAGFTAQMAARPDGVLVCFNCRTESPAATFQLQAQRRTEGASDPDDMLAIVGLVCPSCGAKGTAVLGYGPESDENDAEVLARLGVTRA
ncbi:MAG TPA: hypothetical protein VHF27_11890 [Acidimicrobiales bacterium]|nr:hypothetical protein [Acidimicrobiales bacterium]